jgi:hypothetical protein
VHDGELASARQIELEDPIERADFTRETQRSLLGHHRRLTNEDDDTQLEKAGSGGGESPARSSKRCKDR